MPKEKQFVLALGGSVISQEEINTEYLKRFYFFIKKQIKKGGKFVIIPGGGRIARSYQRAASEIVKVSDEDKDWLGIHATRLNAHLLRTIFRKEAHPVVFDQRFKLEKFGKCPIIIGSGWSPGWSTDYVAIQTAVDLGIREVIILGKPDYVYTSDIEINNDAKPITRISWKDYLKLIPHKWTPGMHAPVDPVAARLAKKEKIKVVVASAKDLHNLEKILDEKEFKGTALD